jgi:hypothetical protein
MQSCRPRAALRCARAHRRDAGLYGEKIGVASAIERDGCDLLTLNRLAKFGLSRLDLCSRGVHGYSLGLTLQLQSHILLGNAVDVYVHTLALKRVESSRTYGECICANGNERKRVSTDGIGNRMLRNTCRLVGQINLRIWNDGACRIFYGPHHLSAVVRMRTWQRDNR